MSLGGLLDRDGFATWFAGAEMNGPGWYDETLVDAVAAPDTILKPWQMQASMGAIVAQ